MRTPHYLPPELIYLRALLHRRRSQAKDRGSITLEWIVILSVLFVAAVAVATKIVAAINSRAAKIK
jgi:hypothetical protein